MPYPPGYRGRQVAMALLHVTRLSQTLQKRRILQSVSLSVTTARVVALLGPNGAGKTTLLKTLVGLHKNPPASLNDNTNHIVFNDQLINAWSVHKRVEHGLHYLPQQPSLFLSMTALENLLLVYHYCPLWRTRTKHDFLAAATAWLTTMELAAAIDQKAETLSGGQQRKLEIIRALLMQPTMLMLDEPFAGIDPKSIAQLKDIFTALAHDGIAIIISDHNVDQLLSIATYGYVMIHGNIVTEGTSEEILENTYTKEHYLGTLYHMR